MSATSAGVVTVTWAAASSAVASAFVTAWGIAAMIIGAVEIQDVALTAGGGSGLLLIWWKVYQDNRATDTLRRRLIDDAERLRSEVDEWRALALEHRRDLDRARLDAAIAHAKLAEHGID